MFNEGFLDHAQLTILRQSLYCGHIAAVRLHREVETRFNQFAVDKNRTRAAFTDDTADVSAGQSDSFAEKMRQQEAWLDIFFVESAINS